MTPLPDMIQELRASRPVAPPALRARVRELAASEAPSTPRPERSWFGGLASQLAVVALILVTVGVIGLVGSRNVLRGLFSDAAGSVLSAPGDEGVLEAVPSAPLQQDDQRTPIAPTPGRAQRVSATLTVQVADAEAVSRAAQDALDLTRSLGGYVVNADVATGDEGSASLTVRVPVAKVQEAIAELSALGRITTQQVTIDDLQAELDRLTRRRASVRAQLLVLTSRIESDTLDTTTRARLEARRQTLREELRAVNRGVGSTSAEARMATIQLTVLTPGVQGVAPVPSRFDTTLDGALGVLIWQGIVALALAIVLAPLACVALAAWLGRRLYRLREDKRLLAAS